jgi:hypothetical protein
VHPKNDDYWIEEDFVWCEMELRTGYGIVVRCGVIQYEMMECFWGRAAEVGEERKIERWKMNQRSGPGFAEAFHTGFKVR